MTNKKVFQFPTMKRNWRYRKRVPKGCWSLKEVLAMMKSGE